MDAVREEASHFLKSTNQIPMLKGDEGGLVECTLRVNMQELLNEYLALPILLLNDLLNGRRLFQDVIGSIFRDVYDEVIEVAVQIELTGLPRISDLGAGQLSFSGVLFSKSDPLEYTKSTSFRCGNKECIRFNVRWCVHRTAPFNVQASNSDLDYRSTLDAILPLPGKCRVCETPVVEIIHHRKTSTCVVGTLLNVDAFEAGRGIWRRPFFVLFNDKCIPHLHLGRIYNVTGMSSTLWHPDPKSVSKSEGFASVECFHLQSAFHPVVKWTVYTRGSKEIQVSPYIYELFVSARSSPWSFVLSLAYDFASEVCPSQTYFKLKLAILLSLASVNVSDNKEDWILPVLAVAYDTSIPDRLMLFAARHLAERCVLNPFNGAASKLLPSAKEMKIGSNRVKMTEGGSVLNAWGGVCYLGDLQKYKLETLHDIRKVLENAKVPTGQKGGGSVKRCDQEDLMTALWTYCSLPLTKSADRLNSSKQMKTFLSNFNFLIDVFGTVFVTDSCEPETNDVADAAITNQLLGMDRRRDDSRLKTGDLKLFLLQVRERRLPIDDEALAMLKNYFVASRKRALKAFPANPSASWFGSATSEKSPHQFALKTTTTLAESFAKMSLRNRVTVHDSVLAIYLYEENLSSAATKFGQVDPRLLNISPEPHFPANVSEHQVVQQLQAFHMQLLEFFDSFLGDSTSSCSSTATVSVTGGKSCGSVDFQREE